MKLYWKLNCWVWVASLSVHQCNTSLPGKTEERDMGVMQGAWKPPFGFHSSPAPGTGRTFLEDRDVGPISHHPCGISDIKSKTTTQKARKNINTWKEHSTTPISVSGVRWVAFARGWARRGTLWMLIVYSVSMHCNTPNYVCQGEHSPPSCSPSRTQKVSWPLARVNALLVPAGVVSGSKQNRPVFVRQELHAANYLRRAIIKRVIVVLTGLYSCQRAMHSGNACPTAGADVRVAYVLIPGHEQH